MSPRLVKGFIITTFVSLYLVVSIISTIHVIDFFKLSNPEWLSISLAVAFEIGAAASLASLITLEKMNRALIWTLFFVLTAMQMMGNAYYAYSHLQNYQSWVELFGLVDEEPIFQKRILSIISGAILPLVALGFIKSLVDYMRPSQEVETQPSENVIETETTNEIVTSGDGKQPDKSEEIDSSPSQEITKETELIEETVTNQESSDTINEEGAVIEETDTDKTVTEDDNLEEKKKP